jgi:hypothetical protein
MPDYEIRKKLGLIPQSIKHRRIGNTIIIESPDEFNAWLGRAGNPHKSFFSYIQRFWKTKR